MVIGAKKTIQHVPSKRHMSIYKIHNFTVQRKQSLTRIAYGLLLTILSIVMISIDPIQIVTSYYMEMREGSFLYNIWESPTYEIITDVRIFNYTNVDEYLNGDTKVLKMDEIGPFRFREIRKNKNITVYKDRGVMTMQPESKLVFDSEGSYGETDKVYVNVPNIALLAISTLLADKLGYYANVGAYYSMSAIGSKLFRNMTVEEYLWGYYDPIVTVANGLLPGWIDFQRIGLLDRFYSLKAGTVELEIGDESKKYSIIKWGKNDGIVEQGYTDANTSIPCNTVKGSYEGIMVSPGFPKGQVLKIYRQQACRIFPFEYIETKRGPYGFDLNSYAIQPIAFKRNSTFDCKCEKYCLPDGFVDVGGCYYGFPIAISLPHFLGADPVQKSNFEGMNPDPEKHTSRVDIEPTLGIPISLSTMIQVNIAVRMSAGNTITKPLKDKVLPLIWISMYCKAPPPDIINILRLRFVIGPPLVITLEVVLFLIGVILGVQGGYRIWKPKYKIIESNPPIVKSRRRKFSYPINISDNKGFRDDDDLAKEAVSLLSLKDDECDIPDLLI